MGDVGETFKALKEETRLGRELFGVPCPKCLKEHPDADPTIMTPQRVCKRHKRHYQDYRTWKQLAIELKLHEPTGDSANVKG